MERPSAGRAERRRGERGELSHGRRERRHDRWLVINRCRQNGIVFTGTTNTIAGIWLGVSAAGPVASPNARDGIYINGGSANLIGGTRRPIAT